MARISKQEQADAIERLRGLVRPGDTIHTVLRHVSASGMSRSIDAYKMACEDDGKITKHWLSYSVAKAGIGTWDDTREAVKMGGAGMDMGFALVYNLSSALWPNGYGCTGPGCRSNDHSNGDRDYTPHMNGKASTFEPGYVGHWHSDGGYALRQEWI